MGTLEKDIKNYISFCVDNVNQNNIKLPVESIERSIVDGVGKKKPEKQVSMSLMFSPPTDPYVFIGASSAKSVLAHNFKGRCHSVLQAVNEAFNNHLPLVFSPDIIYQTILQGISQHINLYPEEYRKFLVFHEGKKDLIIFRPDLSLSDIKNISNNLPSITDDFQKLIQSNSSKNHFDIFRNTFSTTTKIEEVAAHITCMEAFSPYYGYAMFCGCGFPEVRIEGNAGDWTKLRSLIDKIEELFYIDKDVNLTWWTEKLKKLTNHFILAAEEKPVIDWWKNMYKQMNMYLSHSFNGWIGWLYPYSKAHQTWNGKQWEMPTKEWQRNPMLENIESKIEVTINAGVNITLNPHIEQETKIIDLMEGDRSITLNMMDSYKNSCFMSTQDFPLGLSKADLKIVDIGMGESLDTILVGGFLGVSQDEEDGALKPLIGYAMVK
jgi:hypothetical protein